MASRQSGYNVKGVVWVIFIFALMAGSEMTQAQDASDEKERKTIPMPLDLPALAEIDSLDDEDSPIRRFFSPVKVCAARPCPLPGRKDGFVP